jgi:hypothetical protein
MDDTAAAVVPDRPVIDDDVDSEVGSEDFLEDVQLGFVEDIDDEERDTMLFNQSNWKEWDGGKIGGLPVWLNPEHAPPVDGLRCCGCNEPMAFLLQIYSPLDHPEGGSESENTAFHRALYVFCCRKAKCVEAHKPAKPTVQCIRCQLPRMNKYYPPVSTISDEDKNTWAAARSIFLSKTCGVCGLNAPFSCSNCHLARYCSKAHQKLDWSYPIRGEDGATTKGGHKTTCNRESYQCAAAEHINVRFPEYAVGIRNEVDEYEFMKDELREEDERFMQMAAVEQATNGADAEPVVPAAAAPPSGEAGAVDGEDQLVDSILSKTDEADISQRDLQLLSGRVDLKKYLAAKGAKKGDTQSTLDASQGLDDHVYNRFQLHMKKSNNSQVLRYNRWPENPVDGALRISSNSYVLAGTESSSALTASELITEIPCCKHCGSECKFEFQVRCCACR